MGMVKSVLKGLFFESGRVEPVENEKKAETDKLRLLWSRAEGPKVDGIDIDYSYYSPIENGADPEKLYPLVVIMAGALEGIVPGFELEANSLALWTSEKFQKRFFNGASFFLIGRAPEEQKLYWDSDKVVHPLKAAVDEFVEKNPQIDKSRIYTVGWCLGGTGSLNQLASFPSFYAAGLVISPSRAISKIEARRLKSTPVWLMGCKADNYISYEKNIKRSWQRIAVLHQLPSSIRLSTCKSAPGVHLAGVIPFIQNHNMWDNVAEDFHPENQKCKELKTKDGNGEIVSDPFVIDWLCKQTLQKSASTLDSHWKDREKAIYERTSVPLRAYATLGMLHLLDRRGFIELYH